VPGPLTYDGNAYSCAIAGAFGACTSGSVTDVPGSAALNLSCAGDSNHTLWSAMGSITITPATPAVTLSCPTVTYDGNAHTCTATAMGVTGAPVNGAFTLAPASMTAVGKYPITATFISGNADYSNASASGTLTINPPSAATLSVTSVTFPNPIMLGRSSPAQYVGVMSTGVAPLRVSGVTVSGANPQDFLVTDQAGSCVTPVGASLVYHASCNLRIIFAPTATGVRSAILFINDNAPGAPHQVPLSGTAIPGAQLSLNATTLTFAPTAVGALAPAQYITLKSTGYQPVVISKVVLSSGDFDLSDQAGTCTTAATTSLVPGADCNLRVKFHPTAIGPLTVTLVINDNTAATPHAVTLNGTGK